MAPLSKFHGQFVKEQVVQLIRQFFLTKNFHEIDTPTLLPSLPLEPGLYSLSTPWRHRQKNFYLATSPESSLKKLISQGIGNCFAISHAFRDLENIGPTHNLEFSMLEWYEIAKNYHHIAQTTQKLILKIFQKILQKQGLKATNILKYRGKNINLSPPWPSATLQQLFLKYAKINLAKNLKNTSGDDPDWEPWFTKTMIDQIEPNLPQNRPFIIYDYPTRLSPLAWPCPATAGFSQRFEFFIANMEIGNAYTELTDSTIMQKNFQKEKLYRQKHHLPLHLYDQTLVKATKKFPSCTGIAVGVDRLAMLFANVANISQVLYFPTAKLLK
ncbi:hypothetical protein KJ909_00585 [Patescibacteria group bacterium]|nr:hypothetical protein [Patescibacteria group bacterium]